MDLNISSRDGHILSYIMVSIVSFLAKNGGGGMLSFVWSNIY